MSTAASKVTVAVDGVADGVGVVGSGGGGQGDRRDFRAVDDRQRQADRVAVGPGGDVGEEEITVITGVVAIGVRQRELLGADVQNEIVGVSAECRRLQREIRESQRNLPVQFR